MRQGLNGPSGLALDGSGSLYFADSGNGRVRRLVLEAAVPPEPVALPPAVAVANAASQRVGPVAPGELVSIYGSWLEPAAGVAGALGEAGLLPVALAATEVRFEGAAAPLLYVQAGQINAQVPYSTAGLTEARVEVFQNGKPAGAAAIQIAPAAPALFATVLNQDGSLNSNANRSGQGDILVLYATGQGPGNGANLDGKPAEWPFEGPRLPVSLTIAGIDAEILFAGSAPGLVGLMQVNARVPSGFVPPGQAPVQLKIGPYASPEIVAWLK